MAVPHPGVKLATSQSRVPTLWPLFYPAKMLSGHRSFSLSTKDLEKDHPFHTFACFCGHLHPQFACHSGRMENGIRWAQHEWRNVFPWNVKQRALSCSWHRFVCSAQCRRLGVFFTFCLVLFYTSYGEGGLMNLLRSPATQKPQIGLPTWAPGSKKEKARLLAPYHRVSRSLHPLSETHTLRGVTLRDRPASVWHCTGEKWAGWEKSASVYRPPSRAHKNSGFLL